MVSLLTLSPSLQDYLEAILNLSREEKTVRITDIAKKLKVTKTSVVQAVNALQDLNLVVQEKYGPVILTEKGEEEATEVWAKHQILYDFLANVLKVEAEVAEKDACDIEHVVSPQTVGRLVEFLNLYKEGKINTVNRKWEAKKRDLLCRPSRQEM